MYSIYMSLLSSFSRNVGVRFLLSDLLGPGAALSIIRSVVFMDCSRSRKGFQEDLLKYFSLSTSIARY